MPADSPGVPASANAHELFRGFSFVAPSINEELVMATNNNNGAPRVPVSGQTAPTNPINKVAAVVGLLGRLPPTVALEALGV